MIAHIVLFRLRDDASPAAIARAREALAALPAAIPGLRSFDWGVNNSPEGKSHGFEQGFVMLFDSAAARDGYLPHPEHVAVQPLLREVIDDVLVCDIEASAWATTMAEHR